MRGTVLRLGDEEHVGLLTMHHIVSDGWSTGILIREMATLYVAFCAGRSSPLPRCRFNMRTSLTGSGSGCRVKSWKPRLPIGRSNWPALRLCSICPRITPGRPCRRFGVRTNRWCCPGICREG